MPAQFCAGSSESGQKRRDAAATLLHVLPEELQDIIGDGVALLFEREVAGIQQMDFHFGDIFLECQSTSGWENGVVLSPNSQHRWLGLTQRRMPEVVLGQIVLVIVEQGQLDRLIAGTVEGDLVMGPGIGTDMIGIMKTGGVLELGGSQSQ